MATENIAVVWDEVLEPDIRLFQIETARRVLAEEQARGFDRNPRVIVDRRFDAPIESVKPFGRIEFVQRVDIGEVVEWIWKRLLERSPVLTGRYQDSHIVMINGVQVPDIRAIGLEQRGYQPGDRIQFVNTQPYARKIEKGHSVKAPNGVYRTVFAAARRRYGRNLFIDYKFVKLNLGVKVRGFQGGRSKGVRHNRPRKRVLRDQVYPAIQLYQGAAR